MPLRLPHSDGACLLIQQKIKFYVSQSHLPNLLVRTQWQKRKIEFSTSCTTTHLSFKSDKSLVNFQIILSIAIPLSGLVIFCWDAWFFVVLLLYSSHFIKTSCPIYRPKFTNIFVCKILHNEWFYFQNGIVCSVLVK